MKMGCRSKVSGVAMAAFLLGGAWGCVDGGGVYVEDPAWDNAPDVALGFLGYAENLPGQTLCGQCHADLQAEWEETAHADAWATLQGSGHAASYCEGCHTVGALGNPVTQANVGWAATQDPRFHDVQCEACHGPGIEHVSAPAATKPLASFDPSPDGCGECHNGEHHPFVEQWSESAHGSGPALDHAGGRASCAPCHEGQAALEQTFGVDTRYLEKGDGEIRHITCVVCHDPHGSAYDAQLRASVEVPDRTNLCITCHSRRGEPWSSHGPHAAQGLLVLSEDVGYIPEGFDRAVADIPNPHGPRNNDRLCATCHVQNFPVTDESGGFVFQAVGHTFEAISCLDEEGIPEAEGTCDVEDRTFDGCAMSGCHGSATLARSAYTRNLNELNSLLDQLWDDANHNHVMEEVDGGLLPQLLTKGLGSELDPSSGTITPAKGAMWNAMLAWTHDRPHWSDGQVLGKSFGSHPNSGNGVHNPHLLQELLLASIGEVRRAYGLR